MRRTAQVPVVHLRKLKSLSTIAFLTCVLMVSPLSTEQASASSIDGNSCSNFGAKTVYDQATYKCMFIGGRQIWVQILFNQRIPIGLPVTQDSEISFANALEMYDKVPLTAWTKVQDAVAANSPVSIPTNLYIGPNTNASKADISSALEKAYRLWRGSRQVPSFTGLVFNSKDELWAERKWKTIASELDGSYVVDENSLNRLRTSCSFENSTKPLATQCYAGSIETFQRSTAGFAFYGVQGDYWAEGATERGPFSQVTHEYTHLVQFAQWIKGLGKYGKPNRSDAAHSFMPCWFQEGQANAIGIPLAADTFGDYERARDNSVRRKLDPSKNPSFTSPTQQNVFNLLYKQNIKTCYNPTINGDYQMGYGIGYAATEALVAIGGPRATMALLAKGAAGLSWKQAFKAVYGIKWVEAATIISQVVAKQYQVKPMDHN